MAIPNRRLLIFALFLLLSTIRISAAQEAPGASSVPTGDYYITVCSYDGQAIAPASGVCLHLAADGSGFLSWGGVPCMLHWSAQGSRFQFEDMYGISFLGTYGNGKISGQYGDRFSYVLSLAPEEAPSEPEITWSRAFPDGTVIEEMDSAGNYYFHCREDCTPQDILNYFCYYYNLDQSNFACSLYGPETGAYCSFNDLTYMKAASTYKLPLNMYYYDQQARGVYSGSTWIGEASLDTDHYLSLVWSDNDVSEAMIYNLGDYYTYKKLMKDNYGKLFSSALRSEYWEGNYYNTRFMMNTLITLYWRMSSYQELLNYMLKACPGEYLKLYSGNMPVCHKEGYYEGYIHDVGITFADSPFLIAVFTRDLPSDAYAYEVIGRLNVAFAAYQALAMERLSAE